MVETDAYRVVLREQEGGAITSFRLKPSGEELLSGPSNDLVSYRDSGGLWRLGHEFRGGFFVEHFHLSGAALTQGLQDLLLCSAAQAE